MSEDNKTQLAGQVTDSPAKSPALHITPGMVLKGTYRIDAELGSGGMGTVFRATHLGLEKIMAVKVLSPRAVSTPDSLARFEREAKVAGKVNHPAMTHVIDFGVEQGTPYIVMEFVAGKELADIIEREGPMPPRRAVAVMRQIVSLLRAAHALGIVHRDLKPANVKVLHDAADESQLFVKVLDFGVAKVVDDVSGQLTSEGMLVGTPAYMAPEQISGKPIDGRTDLYSAGLIFHEMLSGTRAFKGETIARLLLAQLNDPPPALTVPVPDIVRQTLQKFYEKRPEDRFQDAAEADRALMACEDVLRPPSANLVAAAVLPQSSDSTSGVRTLTLHPNPVEADAAKKPPSSVAFSDSLVKEGKSIEEPALVAPPAPVVVVPEPVPVPVSPPVPPVPVAPPPQAVQPRSSSGKGTLFAVLGVAFVLLVGGLGGAVWAWTSGRLAGVIPFAPTGDRGTPTDSGSTGSEPVATRPSTDPGQPTELTEPQEPVKNEPPPTEPEPTVVAGTETPTETPEAPETAPTDDPQGTPETGEAAGDAPQGEDTPVAEAVAPGCYTVVVAFESSRDGAGKYEPWMPRSVDSRTPINCSAVPKFGEINNAQGLYDHWPDSPSEKLLYSKPLSFQPEKKGEPNTRRMVVKAYTRVSEGTR
ncbi:serine/threonine-protein kinase [Hyalangium rubrum]|uniref:Serine/threonine-protein kinase n=1 Tax=Hyalangium rubrum TaxID=3103134 RepID=A0ABU5HGV9_9BACT|nr:serine/threonine-protein kinase [Hyalangium sp. s54d21]MDY7232078.1 serine/threonine-protein kinase [Hyalangium sp. s54d21]